MKINLTRSRFRIFNQNKSNMTSHKEIKEEIDNYIDDEMNERLNYEMIEREDNGIHNSKYDNIKEGMDGQVEETTENITKTIKDLENMELLVDEKHIRAYLNIEENSLNRPMKEQVVRLLIEIKNHENNKTIRIDVHVIESGKKIYKTANEVLNKCLIKTNNTQYIWVNNKQEEIERFVCVFKGQSNKELFLQMELLNVAEIYKLQNVLKNFLYKNNLSPSNFSSRSDVLVNIWRYAQRYNLLKDEIIIPNKILGDVIGYEPVHLHKISKIIKKFLKPIKLKIKFSETGKFCYDFPILVDDLTNFPTPYPEKINAYKNEILMHQNKLILLEKEKEMLLKFLNNKDFLFEILTT